MASEEICSQAPVLDIIEEADKSIKIGGVIIPAPPIPSLTSDAKEPRLIIAGLTIKDFKSYAGVQKLGPFHKNFTSVVGPNGSGKSNVIDSLLFVFGYRAQKIRSKKISILIHKSEKYPSINCCSVTVHFQTIKDKGESYEVIPGSEFSVTRTGYKDNSSVYEISGKRAQYKEVNKLLQKYGIDLEYSRFLILQGEIELIAMMKSKGQTEQDTGMLEYMEDIIGSNRFVEPIQHFAAKVEELNEIRVEKMNVLKIIEKEMQDIEGPMKKAKEYLKLENKTILIENSILQAKIKNADDELEICTKDKDEKAEKMNLCLLQQEEMKLKKELKQRELNEINSTYEKFVEAMEVAKEGYNKLEREDIVCRENLKHAKEKMKKLVKSLETEEGTLHSLKKQPEVLKGESSELEAKIKDLEAKKEIEDKKLTEAMRTLSVETKDMQEEKEEIEVKLMDLKRVVFQTKSELDLAEAELARCHSNEKREKDKLDAFVAELEKTISTLDEKATLLKEAELAMPQLQAKLATAKQQLIDTQASEIKLSEELRTKRIKVEEIKGSFNAVRNKNAMMKAFIAEKNKGRLTGVLGRLGDLGTIDEKYDVAISTACGNLDHIVTDTLATAQDCVEFLKANDLGYATFIGLDKMKQWEPYTRQKISAPENVERLFDLIRVQNQEILPAFYFSLRDTLVAKDLEQATRIGLQGTSRYRIVTEKGDLIDLSGTMSGGGGRVLKGRMGHGPATTDVSPQELEAMVAEVENLIKNVADLRNSKQQLEEDIQKTTQELRDTEHSIELNKLEFNGYKETKALLTTQIGKQKKVVVAEAPDPKVVKELEKKIAGKQKIYDKADEAASVVEVQVKDLQKKILAITKGKFDSVQKQGQKISKEIDEVRRAISKASATLKSSERKVLKCEEKVDSLKQDIEVLQKNKEVLKEQFDAMAEKAKGVLEKKNEAEKNAELCEEKKAEVVREVKVINEQEHQLKSDQIDLKNEMKCCEAAVKEKQVIIKSLQSKLSKLKMHDVEDEPVALPILTPEEISAVSINQLSYELGAIEAQMENMKPDLSVIYEYKKKEEMHRLKKNDLDDTIKERDLQRSYYDELRKRRLTEFMKGFGLIALKLKEMYQMLTLGGDAELELVDSLDPFSEGISFSVRPPKKSWKAISNLSGGEKTLSSLALVFALHYYRPTPFYVMDEIDAALDFRNVSIVGCYVKERTKNAQFIIISLRNSMFELSNHLIGIYKTYNCTKQVSLMNIEQWNVGRQKKTPKPAEENKDLSETVEKISEENESDNVFYEPTNDNDPNESGDSLVIGQHQGSKDKNEESEIEVPNFECHGDSEDSLVIAECINSKNDGGHPSESEEDSLIVGTKKGLKRKAK